MTVLDMNSLICYIKHVVEGIGRNQKGSETQPCPDAKFMKVFTRFAGRFPLIKTLPTSSLEFMSTITARMSLVLGALTFGACAAGHAQLLEVNVINSTYTASVNLWGVGGFLGNPNVSGSNSVVSASPTSIDYINQGPSVIAGPNYTTVWGKASAGLFQSYAFSETGQGQYMNSFCYVSAISDISFSPLVSQTATINLEFTGYDNWFQSDCLATLNDVTSGQTLWNYGWTANTGAPGSQQFINLPQTNPDDPFALTVPTAFLAGDTYELVLDTDANSNNDAGGAQVQLSGIGVALPLYFVPEPSTFALLGLAATLLMFRSVPRRNLSRLVFRFDRW